MCVCCVCVCALGFVFSILECVSAVFDLSLSADKCGETGDRQTQEHIDAHLQTDGIRVGVMICYSRNLPSQLTMSPGWIGLIKPGRRRAFFFFLGSVCVLALLWASSLFLFHSSSPTFCLSLNAALNQADLLIKMHIFLGSKLSINRSQTQIPVAVLDVLLTVHQANSEKTAGFLTS